MPFVTFFQIEISDEMESVKQWIIGKTEHPMSIQNVVLTPNNIPAFTIPPLTDTSFSWKSESSNCLDGHSGNFPMCSCHNSMTCNTTNGCSQFIRSAPSSPNNKYSCSTLSSDTKEEPSMSIAALSLSHIPHETKFGVTVVRERPTSRRKESLFHDPEAPVFSSKRSFRRNHQDAYSPELTLPKCVHSPNNAFSFIRQSSHKRRNVPSLVAPLGVILTGNTIINYLLSANILLKHVLFFFIHIL